uniref:Uncharacterized protein n=1 Tax=Panagrolaimus sp. ES5 TaxID=591445 RepID=A0AC34GTL0_9BILA
MGDLNGFFEEQYKKVELPLTQLSFELAYITKSLIDIQRDMTLHRMVIKKEDMESLIERCEALDRKVFDHVTLMDSLQQVLRDGWQEQLDKIRRQQNIFKQKLHEGQYLQDYARRALQTALTLRPFALYMASVIAISDTKRSDLIQRAPMEEICLQICNLEPDSRQRVEAIEKVCYSSFLKEAQHNAAGDSSFNTSTCSNGSLSPRDFPSSPIMSDISPISSPVPSEDLPSLQSAVLVPSLVPSPIPSTSPTPTAEMPSTSSAIVPISVIPPPPPPPPEGHIAPIQTSSEDQVYHHPPPIAMLKKPKLPSIDSPSYETVRAREQLLEAIKERVKKIEADD